MLSSDSQDIYLIDQDEERLNYVQSHIDIYTVLGDAASPAILKEAKVESCDLLIAVTSSEKTNLLVSVIAKRFGAKQTIARISEIENLDDEISELIISAEDSINKVKEMHVHISEKSDFKKRYHDGPDYNEHETSAINLTNFGTEVNTAEYQQNSQGDMRR